MLAYYYSITKNTAQLSDVFFAGEEGIEPPQEVLETPVLPLYDSPIGPECILEL